MRLRNTLKALAHASPLQTPLCHYSDVHNRITTHPTVTTAKHSGGVDAVKSCYKRFKLGTEIKPRNALKRSLW